VLTCSVAAYRVLEEKGLRPDYVAGHSLGEYWRWWRRQLSLGDAVVTVRKRGEAMHRRYRPARRNGGRAGAGAREARRSLSPAAQGEVAGAANLNSPDQIVISGHAAAVERAMEAAKAAGAKRAIRLPVSAPFHCALLAPAVAPLAQAFASITFHNLRVPLVTNVDADVITTAEQARDALLRQVPAPVRWEESIRKLGGAGL
jgi:[acyl-carrier-protein] S-malonyltransferase